MNELLDNATRNRIRVLPVWVRDLIEKLDTEINHAVRDRDTAERLLAEHVDKQSAAPRGTTFEYCIDNQTYSIPNHASVMVNLGSGKSLGLTGINGRLVVDGVVAIFVKPIASNSIAVWESR